MPAPAELAAVGPHALQDHRQLARDRDTGACHAAAFGNGHPPRPQGRQENLPWVQTFDTVEQLRLALPAFPETYNNTWLIEWLGYRTTAAMRQALLSPTALAA